MTLSSFITCNISIRLAVCFVILCQGRSTLGCANWLTLWFKLVNLREKKCIIIELVIPYTLVHRVSNYYINFYGTALWQLMYLKKVNSKCAFPSNISKSNVFLCLHIGRETFFGQLFVNLQRTLYGLWTYSFTISQKQGPVYGMLSPWTWKSKEMGPSRLFPWGHLTG